MIRTVRPYDLYFPNFGLYRYHSGKSAPACRYYNSASYKCNSIFAAVCGLLLILLFIIYMLITVLSPMLSKVLMFKQSPDLIESDTNIVYETPAIITRILNDKLNIKSNIQNNDKDNDDGTIKVKINFNSATMIPLEYWPKMFENVIDAKTLKYPNLSAAEDSTTTTVITTIATTTSKPVRQILPDTKPRRRNSTTIIVRENIYQNIKRIKRPKYGRGSTKFDSSSSSRH